MSESTMFADKTGKEIFLGNVVRAAIKPPYQTVHGTWADYEIGKGPGGYLLLYVRSEKGVQLPFGYTACFMAQYDHEDLPDLKTLIFSKKPIEHPALELVEDGLSPQERRELWIRATDAEFDARREEGR